MKNILISLFASSLIFINLPAFAVNDFSKKNPDFFTFKELIQLSEKEMVEESLQKKLIKILNTPFVVNNNSKKQAKLNHSPVLGDFIRVASWNIARGFNFDKIKLIFENEEELLQQIRAEEHKLEKNDIEKIKDQIEILRETDIFLLNEVDFGMPRTNYRNIANEFAEMLGFNYAYGVEFVEVDPTHLGLEDCRWSEEHILFPDKNYVVNESKYKGFHGNAILSRYPLKNVRIIRFPKYYDWFNDEKNKMAHFEKARRKTSEIVFDESILREIRRGSRMALLADVEIPGLKQPLTVISVHLENRVVPKYRYEQIQVLLNNIKYLKNPVALAGDLNTTTKDGRPTTIKREVKKKIKDPHFIGKQLIYLTIPYSYAVSAANLATNIFRIHSNPTVKNIPVLSPNKERKLFNAIKETEFADDMIFDFSGENYRSVNGKWGWLANSNQRNLKGFTPTYKFNRSWWLGQFKLDWIFVKPYEDVEDEEKVERFKPYFGRTLSDLNYSFVNPISDHAPITVDLPIDPPNKHKIKTAIHKIEKEKKKN